MPRDGWSEAEYSTPSAPRRIAFCSTMTRYDNALFKRTILPAQRVRAHTSSNSPCHRNIALSSLGATSSSSLGYCTLLPTSHPVLPFHDRPSNRASSSQPFPASVYTSPLVHAHARGTEHRHFRTPYTRILYRILQLDSGSEKIRQEDKRSYLS